MMSQKREVKVGDAVNTWDLLLPEYAGCEFKVFERIPRVEITKVPDPKPEIPDEPMTRGAVVTIEGDDAFIAVRFSNGGDLPYPYIYSDDPSESGLASWGEIVAIAEGRRIIIHKTVDTTKEPLAVETYGEWLEIPEDERKKYRWRDMEDDIWMYDPESGDFIPEDDIYNIDFNIEEFFPLFRYESIGE